jgi:O-antigen ligase
MNKLPFWFLSFFVFSMPWQAFIVIPGIGSVNRFLGMLLFGIAILYILLKRNIKEVPVLIFVAIMFVVWGILSYMWSINPSATLSRFVRNMQFITMMWLIWELCDSKKDYKLLMQFFVFGLFVSVFDMLSSFVSQSYGHYRIAAEGFGQNRMARYLAVGLPIAWYLYLTERKNILTWINLMYIPIAIFCIILTGSRTGLVIGSIGLLVVPLTFYRLQTSYKITFIFFIFITGIISLVYYSEIEAEIERNITRLIETPEMIQEGRYTGREVIWEVGMRKFWERPLHGFGSNTAHDVIGEGFGRERRAPHSTYVGVLLDNGIIGMLLLSLIIFVATLPIIFTRSMERYLGLVFLPMIFVVMIVSDIATWETLWFVLAILMGHKYILFKDGKLVIVERNS